MSSSVENEILLVSLIGIDQRNRNAIEMAISKKKSGPCVIGSAGEAAVTIVDLDKYGATDEWAALLLIKPEQLAILLSVDEARKDSAHLFLKKPVSIIALLSALDTARNKLDVSIFSGQGKASPLSKLFSPRQKYPVNNLSRMTEKYNQEAGSQKVNFLSEHGYLIDEVKRAVVQANHDGHGIKLQVNNQGSIFIDPTEHWINTDLVPEVLEDLCQHSLNEADVVKRIFSDREFSKYLEEWRDTKLKPIDIDSFLWDLALWTYKGSIPASTDLNKKIILTYWPDLPRLTPVPNAMRIAALWVSCPMTLMETIDVLSVPRKDVFNFYTAATTLGLVRQSEQVAKKSKTDQFTKASGHVRSEKGKRAFYLRILKHLKGHNLDE